jgi:hypothetical protein
MSRGRKLCKIFTCSIEILTLELGDFIKVKFWYNIGKAILGRHFEPRVCNTKCLVLTHILLLLLLLLLYGSTALCWALAAFFSVGRAPWTGDQPVARPLHTHRKQHK